MNISASHPSDLNGPVFSELAAVGLQFTSELKMPLQNIELRCDHDISEPLRSLHIPESVSTEPPAPLCDNDSDSSCDDDFSEDASPRSQRSQSGFGLSEESAPVADSGAGVDEPANNEPEVTHQPVATPLRPEPQSDQTAMTLLHCLFAMVFAAATLGLLNAFGIVARSGGYCPASEGYTKCEVWQDLRSLLSFVLGAALCCVLTRDRAQACPPGEAQADSTGKVQLYACLL